MNKFKLISALREKAYLSKPEATTVVDLFVDNMADALVRGEDANQPQKVAVFQSREGTEGEGEYVKRHKDVINTGSQGPNAGCNSSRITRRSISSIPWPRIASRRVALMSVWYPRPPALLLNHDTTSGSSVMLIFTFFNVAGFSPTRCTAIAKSSAVQTGASSKSSDTGKVVFSFIAFRLSHRNDPDCVFGFGVCDDYYLNPKEPPSWKTSPRHKRIGYLPVCGSAKFCG